MKRVGKATWQWLGASVVAVALVVLVHSAGQVLRAQEAVPASPLATCISDRDALQAQVISLRERVTRLNDQVTLLEGQLLAPRVKEQREAAEAAAAKATDEAKPKPASAPPKKPGGGA